MRVGPEKTQPAPLLASLRGSLLLNSQRRSLVHLRSSNTETSQPLRHLHAKAVFARRCSAYAEEDTWRYEGTASTSGLTRGGKRGTSGFRKTGLASGLSMTMGSWINRMFLDTFQLYFKK